MKTRIAVILIMAFTVSLQEVTSSALTSRAAQSRDPPYLSGMPAVERVKAEIKGTDPVDTAARQAGGFWQLRQVIYDMALSQHRNDRQVTPDEKRLADNYYAAYYNVWQPIEKTLSQDRPRLFKLQGYTADREFLGELLE